MHLSFLLHPIIAATSAAESSTQRLLLRGLIWGGKKFRDQSTFKKEYRVQRKYISLSYIFPGGVSSSVGENVSAMLAHYVLCITNKGCYIYIQKTATASLFIH
jgi:hypothetical protein